MQTRLIANAAICATIAYAVDTMKARRSDRWEKPAYLIEQEAREATEAIAIDPYDSKKYADDGHSCSYAHDRLKRPITTDLNKWVKGGSRWTDNDFTVQDAIYWTDVPFEAQSLVAAQSHDIYWERACEKWPERTLFGEYGVTPSDTA